MSNKTGLMRTFLRVPPRSFAVLLACLLLAAAPVRAQLDFAQEVVSFPDTHEADRYRWEARRNPPGLPFSLAPLPEEGGEGRRLRLALGDGSADGIDEIHVFVTDRELGDFAYARPEADGSGGYVFGFQPKRDALYRFEIVLRRGSDWIALEKDLRIGAVDGAAPETDGEGLEVRVKPLQRFLYAGHVLTFMLDFRIGHAPVTDLEPVQGSDLQAALWRRSWFSGPKDFVHASAFQDTGGPEVPLSLVFPEPGSWVVFAAFRRGGRLDHVRFELDILREPAHGGGGLIGLEPADD